MLITQARRLGGGGGGGGGGGSVGSVEPPRPSKLDPLAQLASWFRLPSLVPLAVAGSASFRFFPLTMNDSLPMNYFTCMTLYKNEN